MGKFIILFSCLFFVLVDAQEIKSVQLKLKGSKEQFNIVPLGSVLELSFDDLEAQEKEYQYKIEHMTYDWKPSRLISNQYINGFQQNYINDITNSFNTLQQYVHYSVNIPNQNSIITKSGNYLISVLDENDEVLFSRRCVFFETKTNVGVLVARSSVLNSLDKQQNVKVVVNHKDFQINNPDQEIKVAILQNYNWKTVLYSDAPQFYRTQQLVYSYDNRNNFFAGNEFRNFDTKNIRSTTINIFKTEMKDLFHNYLYADEPRKNKPYTYNPDINGQFVLRTLDANNVDIEGDYAVVHFSLQSNRLHSKKIYVVGQFNNYELSPECKMVYDDVNQMYIANLKLKQGFYNYQYVLFDNKENIDTFFIDGSFYQTENDYAVLVYYRPFGAQYDQVIGFGTGSSLTRN